MDLVIFHEGDSERVMLKRFIKSYCNADIIEDYDDFLNNDYSRSRVLLYHCGGCEGVIPRAKEFEEVLYSGSISALLVRDTESPICFRDLKELVAKNCCKISQQKQKFSLFARPCFEAVYFADLDKLAEALMSLIKKYNRSTISGAELSLDSIKSKLNPSDPSFSIKKVLKNYSVAFKKRELAEIFFAQFNFLYSTDAYFERLKQIFSGFLPQGS